MILFSGKIFAFKRFRTKLTIVQIKTCFIIPFQADFFVKWLSNNIMKTVGLFLIALKLFLLFDL